MSSINDDIECWSTYIKQIKIKSFLNLKNDSNSSMNLKKDYSLNAMMNSSMNVEDPTFCTVVVVGGEFINKIDAVMEKFAGIKKDDVKRVPEAVFLFLPETYPDNVFSKEKRHRLSPTMVNIIVYICFSS